MQGERAPLAIKYATSERGVTFGWSAKSRNNVNPYYMPVFSPETVRQIETMGQDLAQRVHSQVLDFFSGPLSADLNIPPKYPYEFYEPDKDTLTYTGLLREQ